MKYETPKLNALHPAIDAIQGTGKPEDPPNLDADIYEPVMAYADWEE